VPLCAAADQPWKEHDARTEDPTVTNVFTRLRRRQHDGQPARIRIAGEVASWPFDGEAMYIPPPSPTGNGRACIR